MTAGPYGIARPGRIRPGGFVAVVMIVLLLAATVLFSAAAAHHAGDPHTHGDTVAGAPVLAHHHEVVHDHQHGNGWAPQPAQRIRVLADTVAVAVTAIIAAPPDTAVVVAGTDASTAGTPFSLLGVLRI
ncbi:hypothetical protein [Actinoplanes flavus]|uniref:Uncharacterized protein n=1 Tax=Actinoplanes flavus TaxID=2820290 RepID=A0ABS3UG23_9ACTN|nr:hypothetical protein [Actinoplanes flavus]MBO3737721.1 hypothetical protein [Actinoplanes flavus]